MQNIEKEKIGQVLKLCEPHENYADCTSPSRSHNFLGCRKEEMGKMPTLKSLARQNPLRIRGRSQNFMDYINCTAAAIFMRTPPLIQPLSEKMVKSRDRTKIVRPHSSKSVGHHGQSLDRTFQEYSHFTHSYLSS